MKVKKSDFVEINYIGKIKLTDQVFDLTSAETAKKLNLFDPSFKYGSRIICVGQKEILPGIDNELIGKEVPSKISINLKPEEAFGIRNEKALKTVNTDIFLKQNIQPVVGLRINVEGLTAVIKSTSKARTTLDFNHPLAGKELGYEVEIKSIVTDPKIQLTNLFENAFHLSLDKYSIAYENNKATIKLNGFDLPKQFKEAFENKARELIPALETKFVR